MELGLAGRRALVTGASAGIGRAIAAELAREGAEVHVASRSAERIEAAAGEIGATAHVHDSADLDGAAALLESVGPLDVLVTNTGGPPAGMPLEFTRDQWEDAYRDLVLSPMELVQLALPGMRERGWGRVVNVVSTTVREPVPPLMLSNAHRAATLAAFKTLAREVAPDGVTLNSVLPGRIATDRLFSMYGGSENAQTMASEEVPAGRLGTPEEMAAAAVFLCSERAAYITGVALLIDGGLTRSV